MALLKLHDLEAIEVGIRGRIPGELRPAGIDGHVSLSDVDHQITSHTSGLARSRTKLWRGFGNASAAMRPTPRLREVELMDGYRPEDIDLDMVRKALSGMQPGPAAGEIDEPPQVKRKRLTIKEVCAQEGVSRSTVNKWIREGLPVIRRGRRFVRIDADDLEAFLKRYKVGRMDLISDPNV